MYTDYNKFIEKIQNFTDDENLIIYSKEFGTEILFLVYGEDWTLNDIETYLLNKYKNDLGILASPRLVREFLQLYEQYLINNDINCSKPNISWDKRRILKRSKMLEYSALIAKARSEGRFSK